MAWNNKAPWKCACGNTNLYNQRKCVSCNKNWTSEEDQEATWQARQRSTRSRRGERSASAHNTRRWKSKSRERESAPPTGGEAAGAAAAASAEEGTSGAPHAEQPPQPKPADSITLSTARYVPAAPPSLALVDGSGYQPIPEGKAAQEALQRDIRMRLSTKEAKRDVAIAGSEEESALCSEVAVLKRNLAAFRDTLEQWTEAERKQKEMQERLNKSNMVLEIALRNARWYQVAVNTCKQSCEELEQLVTDGKKGPGLGQAWAPVQMDTGGGAREPPPEGSPNGSSGALPQQPAAAQPEPLAEVSELRAQMQEYVRRQEQMEMRRAELTAQKEERDRVAQVAKEEQDRAEAAAREQALLVKLMEAMRSLTPPSAPAQPAGTVGAGSETTPIPSTPLLPAAGSAAAPFPVFAATGDPLNPAAAIRSERLRIAGAAASSSGVTGAQPAPEAVAINVGDTDPEEMQSEGEPVTPRQPGKTRPEAKAGTPTPTSRAHSQKRTAAETNSLLAEAELTVAKQKQYKKDRTRARSTEAPSPRGLFQGHASAEAQP